MQTSWMLIIIAVLGSISILGGTVLFLLFSLNRKLQEEIKTREETGIAFIESQKTISAYSRQIEQFSLTATSVLSARDEKIIGQKISQVIIEHSDFQRVLISLFKKEFPYREIIGYAGISEELIEKISKIELSASWYDNVFEQGIRFGQLSHYIPHTMKHILNKDATLFGSIDAPEDTESWHPDDNLFVRMNDENGNFIGVISVDDSKSGTKPTDDIVRPLEIFSSMISQIIVLKREYKKRTELEEKLRQAQKMEAIGNLTGGIAHDFNNILGVIIGNAELSMLDLSNQDPSHQSFEEIKTAAIRARDIVQQLLSFSRKSVRVSSPLLLQAILEESLTFMRSTIPASIEIINNFSNSEIVIQGDPTEIYQIIVNLCTNAAQAMEDDGGTLTVSLDTISAMEVPSKENLISESGSFGRIIITDTGTGIPEEFIHQIFDPYFTTKDVGKGTGIGLSIVHGIVQSHEGNILVESKPGSGTTFTVLLPISPQAVNNLNGIDQPQIFSDKGTILFVDDEESLLRIGKLILERCGYNVETFTEPLRGLEAFRQDPAKYDLVITDFTMPQITGDVLAKEILSEVPEMPIILCSGFSNKMTEQQAFEMGISHYLRKPLSMEALSGLVKTTLGKSLGPVGE